MTDGEVDLVAAWTEMAKAYRDCWAAGPQQAELILPSWITPEMFESVRAEAEQVAHSFGLATPIKVTYMSEWFDTCG